MINYVITAMGLITSSAIALRFVKSYNAKVVLLCSIASITLYSGVGIALFKLEASYAATFAVYIVTYSATFAAVCNFGHIAKKHGGDLTNIDRSITGFSKAFGILYFSVYFLYLIYPANRISLLWNPPTMTIYNVVANTESVNSTGATGIFNAIQILFKPFFYVFLYMMWTSGKRMKTIFLIILEFYLNMLKYSYFGRTDLVSTVLMIVFIVSRSKNERESVSRRKLIRNFIIVCAGLVPFLFLYLQIRQGAGVDNYSYAEMFDRLTRNELYYPQYYPFIISNGVQLEPMKYFVWLVTLPIPKFLVTNLNIVEINEFFTYSISGVTKAAANFSFFLPSLVGEALIIFGEHAYFLHAIIVASVASFACNLYVKKEYYTFFIYYIAVRSLAMGRGGSQGYLSTIVNTSLGLITIVLIMYLIRRRNGNSKRL